MWRASSLLVGLALLAPLASADSEPGGLVLEIVSKGADIVSGGPSVCEDGIRLGPTCEPGRPLPLPSDVPECPGDCPLLRASAGIAPDVVPTQESSVGDLVALVTGTIRDIHLPRACAQGGEIRIGFDGTCGQKIPNPVPPVGDICDEVCPPLEGSVRLVP